MIFDFGIKILFLEKILFDLSLSMARLDDLLDEPTKLILAFSKTF